MSENQTAWSVDMWTSFMGSKQTKCLFIYCLLRYSINLLYTCSVRMWLPCRHVQEDWAVNRYMPPVYQVHRKNSIHNSWPAYVSCWCMSCLCTVMLVHITAHKPFNCRLQGVPMKKVVLEGLHTEIEHQEAGQRSTPTYQGNPFNVTGWPLHPMYHVINPPKSCCQHHVCIVGGTLSQCDIGKVVGK